MIVDGEYGEVFVQPIPKTIEIYRKKRKLYEEQVQELKKYINKDTVTQDENECALPQISEMQRMPSRRWNPGQNVSACFGRSFYL